jgi:hypothetical protein
VVAVAVLGVAFAGRFERPARAAPPNAATAQKLFDDGRKAFRDGQIDEACEKFEASEGLEPRSGTALDLAICREKQGRLATASADFTKAATLATSEGHRDRTAYATSRVAELAPRVPRLTLRVSESARARGIVVRLDGTSVDSAVLGVEVPADPGPHAIEAWLSGCPSWSRKVQVTEGKREVVEVAAEESCVARAVARAPPVLVPASPPRSPSEGGGSGRVFGFVLGGTGLASVGVGVAFGVQTLSRRSDAESLARGGAAGPAQSANDDARTDAWIADIAIGAGVAQLAIAAYLLLTSHGTSSASSSRPAPSIGVAVGPSGAFLAGRF